jgi:hypothetical protein
MQSTDTSEFRMVSCDVMIGEEDRDDVLLSQI